MPPTVVLIVEDEVLVQDLLADMVAELGHTVVVASNADEALRLLEARRDITVVITDIDMPGSMDGLRLATNGSFWVIHRTPDTFPTFLNDVAQSFVEFVGNTNREPTAQPNRDAGGVWTTRPCMRRSPKPRVVSPPGLSALTPSVA